ncbi:hypothetical protein FRC00_010041 [Tulasnella sp. 408]|nr:hypothetical protein FRC00_010041 [Tulasnella sp. 408]
MGEIFTILAASPGLRNLFLQGSMQPNPRRPISTVKLEALESLTFLTDERGTTFDALQSIIASPTRDFGLALHASDEHLPAENLRIIGKFASCIADGEAGSVLTFTSRTDLQMYKMEMGKFRVILRDREYHALDLSEVLIRLVEGLPPQRRLAVKTVDMTDMESPYVLSLLPVISSFCPNASHLIIPSLDGDIASRIGGHNNGWIFPHLEFLSITRYRGGRHALKAIEPRLKALESGDQMKKLKRVTLTLVSEKDVVFDHERNLRDQGEIAELGALVPEIIVNRPSN